MNFPRQVLCALTVAAAAAVFSGCAYRSDLAQGNFVEQETIDKLRLGMTSDQVRYLLGTPMLIDPFDNSRWYYVHFLREGWSDPEIKNLILLFAGNRLLDISEQFHHQGGSALYLRAGKQQSGYRQRR